MEKDGAIHFVFPGRQTWQRKILTADPPRLFRLVYYGGSLTIFWLEEDGAGGTDLNLTDVELTFYQFDICTLCEKLREKP